MIKYRTQGKFPVDWEDIKPVFRNSGLPSFTLLTRKEHEEGAKCDQPGWESSDWCNIVLDVAEITLKQAKDAIAEKLGVGSHELIIIEAFTIDDAVCRP